MSPESQKTVDLICKHEGLRLRPYHDSTGKLTIGYGRCLETVGITEAEALFLLKNDIIRTHNEAHGAFTWLSALCPARKAVIIDMSFNIGVRGLQGFSNMLNAIDRSDFTTASDEMLNSEWARQVGERAQDLAKIMRTGEFLT